MSTPFGDFMLDTSQDGTFICRDLNGDSFIVTHDPGETVETNAARLMDTGRAGEWTCGKDPYDMSVCLTEPYSDTVATLMLNRPFATLTEISGSFPETWQ